MAENYPGEMTSKRTAAPRGALADLATSNVVRRQRRAWSRRVASWDRHGSAGLSRVTAAVLEAARAGPGTRAVDLGSGNGQISLPLAQRGATVLAVDVSPAMVRSLREQARQAGATTLHALAVPIEELVLPEGSVDLVVSSYALHHLRDADKARLVHSAAQWLRPGGRIVLADMMLGRGGSRRDRQIIMTKLAALARKGPGGWWRIAKNGLRYLLRIQERPVSADAWIAMLTAAGFIRISSAVIISEACIVEAERPASPASGRD